MDKNAYYRREVWTRIVSLTGLTSLFSRCCWPVAPGQNIAERNCYLFQPNLFTPQASFQDMEDPSIQALVQLANSGDTNARRLICAVLLLAVKDARSSDRENTYLVYEAREWLEGDFAKALAASINLPAWPPNDIQIKHARHSELQRRAKELNAGNSGESLTGLSLTYIRRKRKQAAAKAGALLEGAEMALA